MEYQWLPGSYTGIVWVLFRDKLQKYPVATIRKAAAFGYWYILLPNGKLVEDKNEFKSSQAAAKYLIKRLEQ